MVTAWEVVTLSSRPTTEHKGCDMLHEGCSNGMAGGYEQRWTNTLSDNSPEWGHPEHGEYADEQSISPRTQSIIPSHIGNDQNVESSHGVKGPPPSDMDDTPHGAGGQKGAGTPPPIRKNPLPTQAEGPKEKGQPDGLSHRQRSPKDPKPAGGPAPGTSPEKGEGTLPLNTCEHCGRVFKTRVRLQVHRVQGKCEGTTGVTPAQDNIRTSTKGGLVPGQEKRQEEIKVKDLLRGNGGDAQKGYIQGQRRPKDKETTDAKGARKVSVKNKEKGGADTAFSCDMVSMTSAEGLPSNSTDEVKAVAAPPALVPETDGLGEPTSAPDNRKREQNAANHPYGENGFPNSPEATLLRTGQTASTVLHKAGGEKGGIRKRQIRKRQHRKRQRRKVP